LRSYSEIEINQNIQAVLDNYDRDALLSDENKKQGIPLVFVTKCNPGIRKIKQLAHPPERQRRVLSATYCSI
jgi:hypothetical protein